MSPNEKTDDVKMTIRVPKDYYSEVKSIADRDGNNFNGMLLIFGRIGMKTYEAKVTVNVIPEEKKQN